MLIIDNKKLYIQFIKKNHDVTATERTLKQYYSPAEYSILDTPQSLSLQEVEEYEKIKKRGKQERINRIGIQSEKIDWNNTFQKRKLSAKDE